MKEITPLLEQLANKLGTTIEYLWAILIKQAYISGINSIIIYSIFLILLIINILLFKKYVISNLKDKYGEFDGVYMSILITSAVLWGITIMIGIAEVPNTITKFINPEYWALQEILKGIK